MAQVVPSTASVASSELPKTLWLCQFSHIPPSAQPFFLILKKQLKTCHHSYAVHARRLCESGHGLLGMRLNVLVCIDGADCALVVHRLHSLRCAKVGGLLIL